MRCSLCALLLVLLACGKSDTAATKNESEDQASRTGNTPLPRNPPDAAVQIPDAAPASRVVPGTTRLVVVSEDGMKPKLRRKLTTPLRAVGELDDAPPTDEEVEYFTSLRASSNSARALPDSWQRFEKVVLVHFETLSTGRKRKPKTVSVPLVTAVIMPPGREPVFWEQAKEGTFVRTAEGVSVSTLGLLVPMMSAKIEDKP